MKLLNRLRAIWFRKRTVTPNMVVDTMKAIYEFITGRPAVCLLLLLLSINAQSSVAVEYRLSGPSRTSRYSLTPQQLNSRPRVTERLKAPLKRSVSAKPKADKLIVVSAEWCGPCKRMYPIVERLAAEGYDAEVVYDYDGPVNITAYPTILFLKDGKVLYKNVGVTPERTLRYNLEKPIE